MKRVHAERRCPGRRAGRSPPVRPGLPKIHLSTLRTSASSWYRRFAAGALDRGHAADQRPDLGVAELLLDEPRAAGSRVANQQLVLLAAAPGVAVEVVLRRLPGGEDVELGVAVEVDQPGGDHAVGLDDRRPSGRLRRPDLAAPSTTR